MPSALDDLEIFSDAGRSVDPDGPCAAAAAASLEERAKNERAKPCAHVRPGLSEQQRTCRFDATHADTVVQSWLAHDKERFT